MLVRYAFRDRVIEPLRPFVRAIWYFEGPDLAHSRERVLPDGAMQLLVNLDEDELRWWDGEGFARAHRVGGAGITGAYPGPVLIDTAEQRRITGVSLAPGGAPALFGESAVALAEAQPAIADVWGWGALRERLLDAGSAAAILDTWERALLERLHGGRDRHVEHAVAGLEGGLAVREVARDLGWSAKRLRRRFAERVGLRPKRYARIRRLQRVIELVAPAPPPSWARIAARFGFHDQAHLIRDFRELTGLTPTQYRPRRVGDDNHVVVD